MEKIIRRGVISAVNPENHKARVTFEDEQGVVSAELSVLTGYASQNNLYHLPDVGEMVYCLMEQNDSQTGEGVIIGSIYTEINKPKVNAQDKFRIDFSDGTFIEYDRQSHRLEINCAGEIFIKGTKINLN